MILRKSAHFGQPRHDDRRRFCLDQRVHGVSLQVELPSGTRGDVDLYRGICFLDIKVPHGDFVVLVSCKDPHLGVVSNGVNAVDTIDQVLEGPIYSAIQVADLDTSFAVVGGHGTVLVPCDEVQVVHVHCCDWLVSWDHRGRFVGVIHLCHMESTTGTT